MVDGGGWMVFIRMYTFHAGFTLHLASPCLQVKNVAAPPQGKDATSLVSRGKFADYAELAKGSYRLAE
jgi:hypothetical protein